ncbi:MAG: hypothetical protein MJ065_00485 [Oscillospiraceae bacterium]|nr:hypothetical protein [Oscillospiraceae bacterium]
MIMKVRQLLLRTAILLAVTSLIAGLLLLRPRHAQRQEIKLTDVAAGAAWLELHGWHANTPVQQTTVMPVQWQTVSGQRFLALQQQQGLTPEHHAGETAVRWQYPLENGGSDAWYAELWLCGDTLAAACIYDAETGIMRPVI